MMNPKLKIIREARKILLEKGWCRNFYEDITGRCCLIGAVIKQDSPEDAESEVINLIAELVPHKSLNVTGWNDRPERTKEEVIALLDLSADFVQTEIHLSRPAHKGYINKEASV